MGNKAAVFPLQLLGFDVDIINSVQFSNHTGYPFGFEGEVLDGSMLEKLVNGMERMDYYHLLVMAVAIVMIQQQVESATS